MALGVKEPIAVMPVDPVELLSVVLVNVVSVLSTVLSVLDNGFVLHIIALHIRFNVRHHQQ